MFRQASVPILDGDSLARVDADPDRQWERGVGLALLGARDLELDGGSNRLRRDSNTATASSPRSSITPSAPRLHGVAGQIGEPLGEKGGCGVASLGRESCPAADVGDEEGQDERGPSGTRRSATA